MAATAKSATSRGKAASARTASAKSSGSQAGGAASVKRDASVPPATVAKAAQRGLDLREKHGRGGTEVGVKRAQQLVARMPVPDEDVIAIVSYFARHTVDKDAPGFSDRATPSAGYIAWLLWGGDPGKAWAERRKAQIERAKG